MNKKSRPLGRSLESLPPEKRAQLYRDMADAAFLKAQRAKSPEHQTQYLNLATAWHALAQELELSAEHPGQLQVQLEPPPAERKDAS